MARTSRRSSSATRWRSTKNVSEETAQKIDAEVRRLIDEAYAEARAILTEKHDEFVALAEGLLEYETLSGDEIKALIRGEKPARDLGDDTPAVTRFGGAEGRRAEGRRRAASRKAAWSRSRSDRRRFRQTHRPARRSGGLSSWCALVTTCMRADVI